jgi:hypothetical protein
MRLMTEEVVSVTLALPKKNMKIFDRNSKSYNFAKC